MDDALFMRRFQAGGDLARDADRFINRQWSLEVGALD
jgi:hypothetical protein